jgi:hypothetical protein
VAVGAVEVIFHAPEPVASAAIKNKSSIIKIMIYCVVMFMKTGKFAHDAKLVIVPNTNERWQLPSSEPVT